MTVTFAVIPRLPSCKGEERLGSWVPGLTRGGHHADDNGGGGARALHHDGHQHPNHQPRHGVGHNRVVAEELPGHFPWIKETWSHHRLGWAHGVPKSPARANADYASESTASGPAGTYGILLPHASSQHRPDALRHALSHSPEPRSFFSLTVHAPFSHSIRKPSSSLF